LVRAHPGVELRVHGMDEFDAASLERFDALHSLVLNVQRVLNPAALARLHSLRILHLGRTRECMPLSALASLPALHALELRGAHADIAGMHDFPHLRSLTLVDTPAFDAASMRSRETLRALALAHGAYELNSICALPALERLELRDMRAAQLPDLSRAAHLRILHLRAVRELRDLTPIAAAPALRELRIEAMPQLHVSDFEPLRACASLAKIAVDLQSKAKSREVYRLLALGRIRT
jgi:hypothetical protein